MIVNMGTLSAWVTLIAAVVALVAAVYVGIHRGQLTALRNTLDAMRDRLDTQDGTIADLRKEVQDARADAKGKGSALEYMLDSVARSSLCCRAQYCPNRIAPGPGVLPDASDFLREQVRHERAAEDGGTP